MEFVYTLLIVVAVLAIAIGVMFLVKKNYINTKDLETIKNVFGLSTAIIDELNLKIDELKRKQDSLYDDKFNNIITVWIIC